MKATLRNALCAAMLSLLPAVLFAQPNVSATNGVLGFNLNSYGRLRVSPTPYSSAQRQVDRVSFIAAATKDDVFDYTEDGDTTEVLAQAITIPGVDQAILCATNNDFIPEPPDVRVRHTVMSWNNTSYVFIRYELINKSTTSQSLYLGAAIIPRPSLTYGGETVAYDAAQQTSYYFRTGQTPYWGVRLLNKDAYSVKIRDWDNYSSDPNADAAVDSTRYSMTADAGFSPALVAGANGSMYHHNAGLYTIAPRDTVKLYYAVVYGTSLQALLDASAAALAKYKAVFTAVDEQASEVPASFALHQNYPNPFNPSTDIRLQLPQRGHVSLKIFDAAGREVATLVNRTMNAGSHAFTFDATRLTSGVYFYTVRTNNFTATRKMLLMR